MAKFVYHFVLVALSQVCMGYKILVVFPIASKSHNILGQGYVRHLLDAGHEVTYVTPFPTNKTSAKYHEIDLSKNIEKIDEKEFSLKKILDNEVEFNFAKVSSFLPKFKKMLRVSLENENLLNFLNDASQNFDVVIVEWLFSDSYSGFLDPAEKEIYEEFFGPIVAKRGRVLPPYEEVAFNGSFMLTNSHSSLSQSISVPPNSREISGYHIDPIVKPLPTDLQKLMDEAEHGVIYFSMGSNAKSKDFPDVMKEEFLRVFGALKQTVIWKFEENLLNTPKNVHILHWAPQQSILAHPNCRLFITHGGLLSTTEAVYFKVPTVVMPYGLDQNMNAIRAVNKGYALKVTFSYQMAGEMKVAIDQMLSNTKYSEKVKELSKLYHDRLVPPGKELVHWVEHVVRTGGAPHLRSPALMLPWYQKNYLDLAAVIIIVWYALKYITKKIFSKVKGIFSKTTPVNKEKTN